MRSTFPEPIRSESPKKEQYSPSHEKETAAWRHFQAATAGGKPVKASEGSQGKELPYTATIIPLEENWLSHLLS